MKRVLQFSSALLMLAAAWAPRTEDPAALRGGLTERAARIALGMSPLGAPPADPTNLVGDDPRAARLGQWLFFDPKLSANGAVSCATCHDPAQSFSDGRAVSRGLGEGLRRTPSLWNVAFQETFFWDGRADTLWAQALHPLEDPVEMGGSRVDIARRIAEDSGLATAFESLFGPLPDLADEARFPPGARPTRDETNDDAAEAWAAMSAEDRDEIDRVFAGVGKALAAYERRLVRGDAPFDEFVQGLREGDADKLAALPEAARRGFELFVGRANCRSCHHGPTLQDGAFHDLMLPGADGELPTDAGRFRGRSLVLADTFNAASAHSDERSGAAARRLAAATSSTTGEFAAFKTPSLRNVAERAPFMHRGNFASLADVLRYYSTLEGAVRAHAHAESVLVPLDLTETETHDLLAFLEALTGAPPDPALLAQPPSPVLSSDRQ